MNLPEITLPKKARDKQEILQILREYGKNDPDYQNSRTWSLVYYLGEDHTRFLEKAHNMYFSANGLNPLAFQSLKRFESDVVKITSGLLCGDKNTAGVMTTGGTESCLLAVKTYRDMARECKGIKKPEMIVPETAHVAWEKASAYFNVKILHARLDKNYRADCNAVKKLISRNTVMILGSAPQYPHGLIDPIVELGDIASSKKIPLHVDACIGGYLLPFIEKLGYKIAPWDFRVPGVTSISADTHKYGFAAKGASTIIYRNTDFLKYQFFVYENWPGGVFASPGLLGTRPGGAYAAAWAALQAIGEEGYLKLTKETLETAQRLIQGINRIDELKVIGAPIAGIFAYKSVDKAVNIYAVADQMQEKGWHVDRLQKPEALHAMVTARHAQIAGAYIKDLKDAVRHVKKHPELATSGAAAMYGMIANIPARGMVKKTVLKMFADMYGPEAKMIDPGKAQINNGHDEQTDLATKTALWYLKLKQKFGRG
ncbi:MAG: aspartate aminotransferase family protein [Desulfobacteraceae bacterium]|nr:aspartate aminotransferase family protein [Desulfobacteraceae bacterium]